MTKDDIRYDVNVGGRKKTSDEKTLDKDVVLIDKISKKLIKPHSENPDLMVVGVPLDRSYASMVVFPEQVLDDEKHEGYKAVKLDANKTYKVTSDGLTFIMFGDDIK